MNAQSQALDPITQCLKATNTGTQCGPISQTGQVIPQRHEAQEPVRVADYYCVERNIRGGQTWANAMQACTRYQAQQSIGGYGQALPDSTQRDLIEAQTWAQNAYSQCLKSSSAVATYCGPPP